MIETHLLKLRARDDISAEEEAVIRASVQEVISVPADRVVVREGEVVNVCMMLLSGLAARRKDMPDGRRQFTEIHVAGEFQVMGGNQRRYFARANRFFQSFKHLFGRIGIKISRRLIGQQQFRTVYQSPGYRNPLLLPTRKLSRLVIKALAKANLFKQCLSPRFCLTNGFAQHPLG